MSDELVGKRDRVSNFYSIKNGKVVKELGKTEPAVMDGVTKRTNKNGETVYEIISDYSRGRLVKMEYKEPPADKPKFKAQMELTLQNENGVKALVRIPFDSAYGRGFLLALPNVDLEDFIELEPYFYTDKRTGRDKRGLQVFQEGAKLEWAHGTKANPGDVPKLEKITVKGQEVWDNTEQLKYFKQYFAEVASKVEEIQSISNIDVYEAEEVEDDDLPY